MSRVVVTAIGVRDFSTPCERAGLFKQQVARIVNVAGFAVRDDSKRTLVGHVKNHHMFPGVWVVLQQHVMPAGPELRFYEFPALLDGVGRRGLRANMLA